MSGRPGRKRGREERGSDRGSCRTIAGPLLHSGPLLAPVLPRYDVGRHGTCAAWRGRAADEKTQERIFTLTEDQTLEEVFRATQVSLHETIAPDSILSQLNFTALARVPSGGMVSLARRLVTAMLAANAIASGTRGDFVECGTNSGGTAVVMLKVLVALDDKLPDKRGRQRLFWGFDSFKGLPENEFGKLHPVGTEMRSQLGRNIAMRSFEFGQKGQFYSSRREFEENLRSNGVYDEQRVHVRAGWFNDTLPIAPIRRISFLRLDGGAYPLSTRIPSPPHKKPSIPSLSRADWYTSTTMVLSWVVASP